MFARNLFVLLVVVSSIRDDRRRVMRVNSYKENRNDDRDVAIYRKCPYIHIHIIGDRKGLLSILMCSPSPIISHSISIKVRTCRGREESSDLIRQSHWLLFRSLLEKSLI
jgi:hypothetical protein